VGFEKNLFDPSQNNGVPHKRLMRGIQARHLIRGYQIHSLWISLKMLAHQTIQKAESILLGQGNVSEAEKNIHPLPQQLNY